MQFNACMRNSQIGFILFMNDWKGKLMLDKPEAQTLKIQGLLQG